MFVTFVQCKKPSAKAIIYTDSEIAAPVLNNSIAYSYKSCPIILKRGEEEHTSLSPIVRTESEGLSLIMRGSLFFLNDTAAQNQPSIWVETCGSCTERGGGEADYTEREALMELYNALGGERWANNAGWGQGAPSDRWHGIRVNARGQVTRVDLFNNGLKGSLPESIGALRHVRYLNLKGNKLTGSIPESIGQMASLEWLILSGRTYEIGGKVKQPPTDLNEGYHQGKHSSSTNRFSGTIPSSIGKLTNLEFLEISDQPGITGPIPSEIGNLKNLKGLYLNYNDFKGYAIPESIGNLTQLRHLYIADSHIGGRLPRSLKNLTKLTHLIIVSGDTKEEGLTGPLPDLSRFTNLRSLNLSKNRLEGEYPAYFNNGNFTHLHTLRLSWNKLTGTLHGFDNLPQLGSFAVSGNNLSGTITEQLTQLPERLQILGLGWNNFSGKLPQTGWPDFWQLKTLYLNNNKLSGRIPCDFWNKIDNSKLNYAWLSKNNFTSNCTSAMNNVKGSGDPNIAVGGNNF